MTHAHDHANLVPRRALLGAGGLVLFAMAVTAFGQQTELGTSRVPEARAAFQVDVRFEDHGASGVDVVDADSGEIITRVPSGKDNFVRGVLRGLNRTRKLEGLDQDAPFRLTRWSDGRMSIDDLTTGHDVELQGFGLTNLRAFSRLLAAAEERS